MNTLTAGRSVLYPNTHWYFALAVVVTWVGFSRSYFARFVIIEIVLLLLISDDKRNHGRIWKPYPLALMLFALLHLGMNFAGEWAWWHASMDWFARL